MKKTIYIIITIILSLAIGISLGTNIERKTNPPQQSKARAKLNELINLIEKEYVDGVNSDSIITVTMNSLLGQLDPHSEYIDATEVEESYTHGGFVGIGINYEVFADTIAVIKTIENGAAAKVGIMPGDRILYADDQALFNQKLSSEQIANIFRGKVGSSVALKIFRKKTNNLQTLTITRQEVPLKSVDTYIKVNDTLGYIKINRFSETTYQEFQKALTNLTNNGNTAIILDLRDNGGGLLDQAVKITNEFLVQNQEIVRTVNKNGQVRINKATKKGIFTKGKLYVFINENTASASEIIAGAIQDNDRGTIVGRRSYGKGLVQKEIRLQDGALIRMTTARYYTPSGRSIQKSYQNQTNYQTEIAHRFLNGELYEKDSIQISDTLKFKTLSGRIVYGGGGIVPDVFVPLEQKEGEESIRLLMKMDFIVNYVFTQIDKDRTKIEQMTPTEIYNHLQQPEAFNQLKAYLKEHKLTFNLDRYKSDIVFYLTAEYINQSKTENQYYQWLIHNDNMIKTIVK